MKFHTEILLRTSIVTVIYVPIFLISILASTLIVQSHVHPDNWVTTKYDIATGVIVVLMYLATIIIQIRITRKKQFKNNETRSSANKT